jgi:hypothetical protein
LKKPAGSVRVGFFLQKTEPKSKKNRKKNRAKPKKQSQNRENRENRAKTGKTEPNRFEPVFALKNRTEPKPVGLTWFRFGFGFFFKKKNSIWLLFLIKTEPNRTENDYL